MVSNSLPSRRAWLQSRGAATACALIVTALLLVTPGRAENKAQKGEHWVGTWASSPQPVEHTSMLPNATSAGITLRQVVHVSVGGKKIRLRFSNTFGSTPLTLGSVHVATAKSGGAIEEGTDEQITFRGRESGTIPAGAVLYSDSLAFDLRPLSNLAVTMQLSRSPEGATTHEGARAISYWTQGNVVSAGELPVAQMVEHWYFLNGVDVVGRKSAAAVAVLGDSITDGKNSTTNANLRWTDELAKRLQRDSRTRNIGVLNEGIGGNRLLQDGLGPNALARLDRDVFTQSARRWVVVFEGVNDLGTCEKECDLESLVPEMIAAYEQIVLRAHSQGLRVYGATLTPFGGSFYDGPGREEARQRLNSWMRTSGAFDAVVDFDAALRDPENPARLFVSADSGDHLHPNDTGYKMLGDAIDLKLFAH